MMSPFVTPHLEQIRKQKRHLFGSMVSLEPWAMDGYGWLWMAMDGYGWLWMAMDGYGWLRMAMDGYGWLWMAAVQRATQLLNVQLAAIQRGLKDGNARAMFRQPSS